MPIFRHITLRTAIFIVISLLFINVILTSDSIKINTNHVANTNSNQIVIDYNTAIRKLDPIAIGMDIGGYGYPYVFANDPTEQEKLNTLGIKYMRMDLKYSTPGDPTSLITCAAHGCDKRWTGDQWVQAMKATGAQPLIIVPSNPVDAANILKHFNKDTANHVQYWIIGNEPNQSGSSASTYSNSFNKVYDAMKAIDPTIKIGGGATAWYDVPFLQTFLQLSGNRVDFVDFHGYAQQGKVAGDYKALFQIAAGYGESIDKLRSLIQQTVPARASQIGIEVGEWELNWGGGAQNNTNFHAVWAASVLGHILSSGGWSLFYADKGNALFGDEENITDAGGHTVNMNVDDTKPPYHGIGMFTGEKLFRGFGNTIVQAKTTLSNIEIFASDNQKNIVVINKDPSMTQTANVILHGATPRTVKVWRKDESVPFADPPIQLKTLSPHNGTFTYQFPPFSITTFVVM